MNLGAVGVNLGALGSEFRNIGSEFRLRVTVIVGKVTEVFLEHLVYLHLHTTPSDSRIVNLVNFGFF